MTKAQDWTPPDGWECPKCKAAREANAARVAAHRVRNGRPAKVTKAKSIPKPGEPVSGASFGPIAPAIGSRLKQPKKAKA